jgi:hypothetical protein
MRLCRGENKIQLGEGHLTSLPPRIGPLFQELPTWRTPVMEPPSASPMISAGEEARRKLPLPIPLPARGCGAGGGARVMPPSHAPPTAGAALLSVAGARRAGAVEKAAPFVGTARAALLVLAGCGVGRELLRPPPSPSLVSCSVSKP